MGLISNVLGASVGETVDKIAEAIDRFVTSDKERADLRIEFEKVLQARYSESEQTLRAQLGAQERILVAELQQDDNYTKRARPTIVYFGLLVIFFNYCLIPLAFGAAHAQPPPLTLPSEFWYAWGGVCGIYAIGRTKEKMSTQASVDVTTGKPIPQLDSAPLRILGER